jgi:sugar lactone lactonase YvrE
VVDGSLRRPSPPYFLRFVLALCAIVACGLLFLSAQASGSIGYQQKPGPSQSFPPTPTGVAVDNSGTSSDGDVYVVDGTSLYEFDAAGDFLTEAALSGNFSADRVAVDDSGAASAGEVYVTVPGSGGGAFPPNGRIYKLSRGFGSKLGVWGSVLPTGVAVDATGNVYVAQSESEVAESSSSGAPLNVVEGLTNPEGIAVDSHGDLYVASETGTVEFTRIGAGGFSAAKTIDAQPASDVAVDSSTGNVFIAVGNEVDVFDASGSEIGVALGSEATNVNTYKAVGESEATGDVYAVNALTDQVEVAEPEGPPERPITEACTGPIAVGVYSLCGTLNPHASAKAGFYFAYSKGSSCKGGKTPLEPEAVGEGILVSGQLTGLEPNSQYTYCLVATNPQGKTFGQAVSFKTPEMAPTIDAESVSGVTEYDATFEAQINPNGLETAYQFGVVASPCHANPINCELVVGITLFPSPAGELAPAFGDQSADVNLASAGMALEPGHEYHYTVFATSAAGSASGPDQTFTTPGPPPSTGGTQGTDGTPSAGAAAKQAESTTTADQISKTSTPKPKVLANAQSLAKALKACEKRRTRQRARCERQARRKYGATTTKARRSSKRRKGT